MALPEVTPKRYRRFALTALLLVATIIITGSAVRLSGSGLGCNDWPNCTAHELIQVTNKNQAIEQINRLFTGLVSIGVMIAVLGSLRRSPRRRDLVWLSWSLVGGVFLQALLGGLAVLVKLKWQSVALHFLASIVLLSAGLVLYRRSGEGEGPYIATVSRRSVLAGRVILGVSSAVLIAGTLVTGAGPHGGDAKATRLTWAIPTVARIHGALVWTLVGCVLALVVMLHKERAPAPAMLAVEMLLGVIVLQGSLGYYQYLNGIPALAVGFHVFGAVLVFSSAQWLQFTLRSPVADMAV